MSLTPGREPASFVVKDQRLLGVGVFLRLQAFGRAVAGGVDLPIEDVLPEFGEGSA